MTSREFTEWQAFFDIQPFGEPAEDMRGAWSAYLNHLALTGDKDVEPNEFMLPRADDNRKMDYMEMFAICQEISEKAKTNER